ncbi:MAG: hypothetical protein ACT4O0_16895 [Pseudonocardia sp.]
MIGMLSALARTPVTLSRVLLPCQAPPSTPDGGGGAGPVVVVGGFCSTERALRPLAGHLARRGHRVLTHTAHAGMGCAARAVSDVCALLRVAARLDTERRGVGLVGYSRGGQFVRVAAQYTRVDLAAVVTIGTPFELYALRLPVLASAAVVTAVGTCGVPHLANARCLFGSCCADFRSRLRAPVPAPFTSVYSRRDMLVPWSASHDPAAVNVEVAGNHRELLTSAQTHQAVEHAVAPVARPAARAA